MLAATFLISRPALAGDEAPKSEKTAKGKKDDKKAAAPAKDEKKDDKEGLKRAAGKRPGRQSARKKATSAARASADQRQVARRWWARAPSRRRVGSPAGRPRGFARSRR